MKKRVLKIAALLMAAMGFAPQAQADTDLLTQEKGYTKITQMPADENLDDYYFIIVDKNNDLMITLENDGSKKWYYRKSVEPALNLNADKLWTIEKGTKENSYSFRSVKESEYLIETEQNAGWNFFLKTSTTPNDNTSFTFAYAEDSWTFESVVNAGQYIGPWDANDFTDGANTAANKGTDQRGYFVLYSIPKTALQTQYAEVTQMPADNDLANYYFIIKDNRRDLMVALENNTWYYRTSADPVTNRNMVWTIEKGTKDNSYSFRCAAEPTYLMETEQGKGWNFFLKTSTTPNDNTSFTFAYADNCWTFESAVNASQYIGPWDANNFTSGANTAANKGEGERGYFVLYSIERATFDNQELAEAKSEATAEIADYEAILNNSTAESEVNTTYSTAISRAKSAVNGATDTETIDAAMAALEKARQEYVMVATPTNSTTFDMTFLIQNAAVTSTDGWTNARTNQGEKYTGAPDDFYFDTYGETRDMFQNITVRPGVYKLTAATRAEASLGTGYIYINETKADVAKAGNQGNTLGAGWAWTTTQETAIYTNAKIGFYSECGGGKWAGADNFKLEFVRPLTDDETLSLAKESLQQKFDETSAMNLETNVGNAAFQIPTSLAQAVRIALLTAGTTAEKTDATLEEVDNAIKALDNAVAAFNAPTLNAPAAGDRFNVIINADGGSIDNMAWTCIYDEAKSADGWYNLQWAHAADANYAQALIFTPTGEKNQYTISFIDAEGNTRYVCTQKAAGYMDGDGPSGRADRIRVTTDATKALKVNISATATEGIWHLNNTEHGQNVGATNGGDAGVFTSNSVCGLTLVKAEEAEVSLTVTEAGWATLILPFNAEVPDGLAAYTCSEAEETATEGEATLVLEEAATLAANTPYIIQGAADTYTYNFSGYGLATQDTYGNSFMTGTLVEKAAADQGTYVLQNQDGKVGFYLVGDAQPAVGAYRAYLNAEAAPAGSNVQAFILKSIDGDGTTTGIGSTVAEADATVNVYNLNGILVRQNVKMSEALDGLQKGIYIVNGTKKAVK